MHVKTLQTYFALVVVLVLALTSTMTSAAPVGASQHGPASSPNKTAVKKLEAKRPTPLEIPAHGVTGAHPSPDKSVVNIVESPDILRGHNSPPSKPLPPHGNYDLDTGAHRLYPDIKVHSPYKSPSPRAASPSPRAASLSARTPIALEA